MLLMTALEAGNRFHADATIPWRYSNDWGESGYLTYDSAFAVCNDGIPASDTTV